MWYHFAFFFSPAAVGINRTLFFEVIAFLIFLIFFSFCVCFFHELKKLFRAMLRKMIRMAFFFIINIFPLFFSFCIHSFFFVLNTTDQELYIF